LVFTARRHRWHDSRSWFWRHSLSIVLVAIFVLQTAGYLAVLWPDWSAAQAAHGQPATAGGFATYALSEMMVSMLAEPYGVVLIVLLGKVFFEEGSPESKDPEE
jgi:hypothetical protein